MTRGRDSSTPWLDVRAAAARALCSDGTVLREARAGRLRGYKIGGRRLLKPSELDAYIATHRVHGDNHVEADPVPDGVGKPD